MHVVTIEEGLILRNNHQIQDLKGSYIPEEREGDNLLRVTEGVSNISYYFPSFKTHLNFGKF